MAAPDHLNVLERTLIDRLRDGTYNTTAGIGSGSAWDTADITVFGQFPTTDQTKYPCIVTEMLANGIQEQFMGQKLTFGGSAKVGELYGVAFRLHIAVDRDSTITVESEPYKERRLLNYLMINGANVVMDCDFSSTTTEMVERQFSGFQDVGYNPESEIWAAMATLILVFKNDR
jgi:hypothetical protein|tara:strand:- start:1277 stop:1798 length:522 start_codon:yes stop_codon:yes gene_type:complete